jgi:hypothetical protein
MRLCGYSKIVDCGFGIIQNFFNEPNPLAEKIRSAKYVGAKNGEKQKLWVGYFCWAKKMEGQPN